MKKTCVCPDVPYDGFNFLDEVGLADGVVAASKESDWSAFVLVCNCAV